VAGHNFAQTLRAIRQHCPGPTCLLAGGETTVQVRGTGKGGRNQEFALAVAQELAGEAGWSLLSAGTDGIDGPTDAAGAFVDGRTLGRARRKNLDPARFLRNNDTYTFFSVLGDLFSPGSTGTNVMDIKIALVNPPGTEECFDKQDRE
jgi:glycerate-2-kinase